MHMETLVLDGKEFIKASKVARDLGYTSDYVGQLCRGEKVSAHLVGRTWYVNKDEIANYKVEKKRISRVKAREQAKKTIEEHRQKTKQPQESQTRIVQIQYETDNTELIPKTRKLAVHSDAVTRQGNLPAFLNKNKADELVVENKGEKIVMEGSVTVVDASDDLIDSETVFLSPKINKMQVRNVEDTHDLVEDETPDQEEDVEEGIIVNTHASFEQRLAQEGVGVVDDQEPDQTEDADSDNEDPIKVVDEEPASLIPYVLLVFLVSLLVFVSFAAAISISYSQDGDLYEINRYISIEEGVAIIKQKI
jgi:hypothetical protein